MLKSDSFSIALSDFVCPFLQVLIEIQMNYFVCGCFVVM